MTYLLDVNALIGLAWSDHQFHSRLGTWLMNLDRGADLLATCAISELGLIRIIPQVAVSPVSVNEATEILQRVKATAIVPFTFFPDSLGGDKLPSWVRQPKQTTDGHLLELAKAHKAVLASCDKKIPGAFLIPV
jgi:predicted nucleic acid-binding protein